LEQSVEDPDNPNRSTEKESRWNRLGKFGYDGGRSIGVSLAFVEKAESYLGTEEDPRQRQDYQ
jgi:hypothetical protein